MNTHTRWLAGTFTAALALSGADPVLAQVPRVELSGDFSGFSAPGEKAILSPASRVTVAINPRFAIESGIDSVQFDRGGWGSSEKWIYSVRVRQTIKPGREPGSAFFVTYGLAGGIEHEHWPADRYISLDGRDQFDIPEMSETRFWPLIPTVGFGGQWVVARYLAVRADAQAFVVPFDGFGGAVRFGAGVTVPIGGYKR